MVDESLRLYPPAFVIVRQALDHDEADGVPIKKGALVLIAPWIMRRHCRFWRAPDRFDPSRFMPEASPPPRFAYIPFGAGPRICVGSPLSLTELVLVVASLLRAFRIELGAAPPGHARRARHAATGCSAAVPADAPRRLTDLPQAGESSWRATGCVDFFLVKSRRVA